MTTNNAALTEARAAGIDAAIEAIEAQVTDTEATMAEHSAALRDYNACVSAVVPGLLSCLRKLAAETRKAEPVKPNPFDGFTIETCGLSEIRAADTNGNSYLVGIVDDDGWIAWPPLTTYPLDKGPETGNEGRALAEKALVKAGASIPWHKDTTSADLIEAAGRG